MAKDRRRPVVYSITIIVMDYTTYVILRAMACNLLVACVLSQLASGGFIGGSRGYHVDLRGQPETTGLSAPISIYTSYNRGSPPFLVPPKEGLRTVARPKNRRFIPLCGLSFLERAVGAAPMKATLWLASLFCLATMPTGPPSTWR